MFLRIWCSCCPLFFHLVMLDSSGHKFAEACYFWHWYQNLQRLICGRWLPFCLALTLLLRMCLEHNLPGANGKDIVVPFPISYRRLFSWLISVGATVLFWVLVYEFSFWQAAVRLVDLIVESHPLMLWRCCVHVSPTCLLVLGLSIVWYLSIYQ